nr:putative E3 ubiquitin-protein ligase makorin-1 [Biomphalaria glabrata]
MCTVCHVQMLNPLHPAKHCDACKQLHIEKSICLEKGKEIQTNIYITIQEHCNHCISCNCLELWQEYKATGNNEACSVCPTPSGYLVNYE